MSLEILSKKITERMNPLKSINKNLSSKGKKNKPKNRKYNLLRRIPHNPTEIKQFKTERINNIGEILSDGQLTDPEDAGNLYNSSILAIDNSLGSSKESALSELKIFRQLQTHKNHLKVKTKKIWVCRLKEFKKTEIELSLNPLSQIRIIDYTIPLDSSVLNCNNLIEKEYSVGHTC